MVKAYNQAVAKKGFIFKVGKHNDAEAMTLEGLREIKIPQARPAKYVKEPHTYWLASEEKNGKKLHLWDGSMLSLQIERFYFLD